MMMVVLKFTKLIDFAIILQPSHAKLINLKYENSHSLRRNWH